MEPNYRRIYQRLKRRFPVVLDMVHTPGVLKSYDDIPLMFDKFCRLAHMNHQQVLDDHYKRLIYIAAITEDKGVYLTGYRGKTAVTLLDKRAYRRAAGSHGYLLIGSIGHIIGVARAIHLRSPEAAGTKDAIAHQGIAIASTHGALPVTEVG